MSRKYIDEVKDGIEYVINDYISSDDYRDLDRDELSQQLYDDLWIDDHVTGNGSGSFTMNREEAKEIVLADGFDTLVEAIDEGLYTYEELGKAVVDGDWETLDVIARCTVLGQAIGEYLDEHNIN